MNNCTHALGLLTCLLLLFFFCLLRLRVYICLTPLSTFLYLWKHDYGSVLKYCEWKYKIQKCHLHPMYIKRQISKFQPVRPIFKIGGIVIGSLLRTDGPNCLASLEHHWRLNWGLTVNFRACTLWGIPHLLQN